MKRILLFFSLLLTSFVGYSQNKGINYQAVIIDPNPIEIPGKDVAAQPFVNKEVWLKFTISQDGVTQYEEIQKTQTDNYGLVNLTIGTGINTGKGGTFASLSWEGNTKNIVTSVSFDKGSKYVEVGNQKLNHVPYSLYSETANKLSGVLPISSGGTGAITSTAARANLGLDKVDNTSDMSKPVSTATLAILDTKESLSNKSTNIIADSASSVKYPSVKAIKDYIDSRNSASANSARLADKAKSLETPRTINGVPFDGTTNITIPVGVTPPDASATVKGLVQLAGDLSGTAASPEISVGAVTTIKITDAAVTDAKIATVSGSKVTGNISGNAANVTGTIAVANGGTGATTAAAARTNLGLVIGTDVQAPLTAGTDYLRPNGSAANLTNFPTLNQSTTGNAATATKLAAPKNINGVPFDGSADITVAADAATLSGTVAIAKGGTGATTAADARTNLGLVIGTDVLAQRSFGTAANSAATDFVATTEKGANNGVATLGVNGKIPSVQIPALSFQNVTVVNSDATMTAITGAQVGSIAIRTDNNNNYVLSALPASVSNNWIPLAASNDVSLINGIVGPSVNLTTNEIPEGNTNKYYTDARVRNALSAVAPLNYNASTGVLSMTAASASANGYLSAADFTTFNNKQTALTAGVDYATPSGNITGNAANVTGIVSIANGGTGTSTATGALVALGAEPTDNKSNNILLDGNSTTKFPSFKAIKDYVDQQSANAGVADNSITSAKINGTLAVLKGGTGAANPADARTNLGLVIGTDVMAANFTTTLTGDVAGSGNGSFATTVNSVGGVSASAIAALPTNVAANTASITANGNSIATLNTNVAANTASITANGNSITTLNTNVAANTASITANGNSIVTLNTNVAANTVSITANETSIATLNTNVAANTASITANSNDLALKAPLASPTFTGTPTAPTPATSDNSTTVATTEYVKNSIVAANAGLSSIGVISGTSNARGATISGTTELILTPADASNGGIVTTGAQTFAGAKTFTNTVTFGKDITVNGLTIGGSTTYGNTALGYIALNKVQAGSYNAGSWNTAIGHASMYENTTGNFNTAIGRSALLNNTTGSYNTTIGFYSGASLRTISPAFATENTFIGNSSGAGITTGSYNTILGSQTYTIVSGAQVGIGITTGSNNTIIGGRIFGLAPTLSNNIILADGAGNIRAQHNGTTGWTLGTIVSGTWSGTTIGSNVGGAGSVNGLMKADGSGVVSAAVAGTDYLSPSGSAALLTNFPTLNQSTTGNAATATALATPRNINGIAFDGSANITIAADANTLTGTTLASNITASSLTSVGTITSGIWSATEIAINKGGTGATTAAAALTNLGAQSVDNMSTNITTDAASITRYPSVKLIKDYVDTRVASAGVSDGSITNVKLANSTTILGSTTMTLGGTVSSVTGLTSLEATNLTGTLSGTATALATGRTISTTGDVEFTTGAFNGTSNVTGSATLTNTTVTAGTYGSSTAIPTFTVDSKGRLTSAGNVGITAGVSTLAYSTTGASNGGTISGTTLTLTAADASNPGLISTGTQTIAGAKTFSTDITAPNFLGNATTATTAGNITATSNTTLTSLANLATVGTITSGVWSASTIDIAKGGTGATTAAGARTNLGLVIGTDVMAANYTTTLTGDVTGAGNGSFATTLAASGVTSGTYGSSTAIPTFTVDSKGRLTAAGNVGITAGVSTLAYSNTGSANGGTISGTALTLTAADASNPGLISTGAQTIAGAKTFNSDLVVNGMTVGKGGGNVSNNTALGFNALTANVASGTPGINNTAMGYNALSANTTGGNNVAIGNSAGSVNVGGSNNVFIGNNANAAAGLVNNANAIAIGSNAIVDAPNKIQLGDQNITAVNTSGTITAAGFTGPLTGNATTATTASNISATSNTTLTSLANLATVGTITTGVWSGTTISIAKGGTGATTKAAAFDALSPMTTSGDIIYGGTSGTGTRLAKGTDGQVLTLASGLPSWASPSGITALAAIGSTANANGASISGSTLNLQPASADFGGVVTTGTQTFAGAKTFNSDLKVNGLTVGKGPANFTTLVGLEAGLAMTSSGTQNVAVGYQALKANTGGTDNVAVGNIAATTLTTGTGNVALGSQALRYATTGGSNNAIGNGALGAVTTASNNIGIGAISGSRLTTGANNILIGSSAGTYFGTGYSDNTTGLNSVLIGFDVRPNGNAETNQIVISGYNGSAGTVGLGSNTTLIGSSSTTTAQIMGDLTLPRTTASTSTTTGALKVGGGAGIAGNVYIGGTLSIAGGTPAAGDVLTSDANGLATWSAPAGITALAAIGGIANANGASISGSTLNLQPASAFFGGVVTTGTQTFEGAKTFNSDLKVNGLTVGKGPANFTTLVGLQAGLAMTSSGQNNVAVGYQALTANTSGTGNVAVGSIAGSSLTTGASNVALGNQALRNATTGFSNTAIGAGSLSALTNASGNIGIGSSSGSNLTTGEYNINIGSSAGTNIGSGSVGNTTGNYSIMIGTQTRPAADGETNQIVIAGGGDGITTVGLGSNTTLIGSSSTTTAQIMGDLTLPRTTASTSTTTGALKVGGGAGIAGAANIGGITTITNATASTSSTSGALRVAGGAGIAGALNVGGNTVFTGTIEIDGGSPGAGKVLVSDANGLASWSANSNGGVSSISASATMAATDNYNFIVFSGATASQTITLPSASLAGAGREITIKNIASVSVAVNATAGNLISDSTTTTATSLNIGIEPSNNWIKAISNGTNWIILRALF